MKEAIKNAAGIRLATIALLISIVLLMVNKFITIEKQPTKVEVVDIRRLMKASK